MQRTRAKISWFHLCWKFCLLLLSMYVWRRRTVRCSRRSAAPPCAAASERTSSPAIPETNSNPFLRRKKKNIEMFAFIHTYIHTYIQIYVHTYIHTYKYFYTYTHTYIHTYIHTCIHTYIHTYINRCDEFVWLYYSQSIIKGLWKMSMVSSSLPRPAHRRPSSSLCGTLSDSSHSSIHLCLIHTGTTHIHSYIHTYIQIYKERLNTLYYK